MKDGGDVNLDRYETIGRRELRQLLKGAAYAACFVLPLALLLVALSAGGAL